MNPSVPWRPLLGLTAAVMAIHFWLLRAAPEPHRVPQRAGHASPLVTRTISAPPSPEVEAPPTAMLPVPKKAARAIAAVDPAPRPLRDSTEPVRLVVAAAPLPVIAAATLPVPHATAETHAIPLALNIPPSVRLHYEVTAQSRGLMWQASSELDWRHDGSSYEAKLELHAPMLPARTQRSTGKITPEGLAPVRFSDKGRREEAAHFEREKGKVSFSSNRPDAPLLAGAQDRLSVMLQLGAMIAGAPGKFRPPATIAIQTAGTRDAESWQFTVEGEEQLQLPGGAMKALKLIRNPRKEFDQKVELWLGPSLDYAPVRLRLTHPNGDWIDQQWSSTDRG